jgi:hypothetical protein
MIGKVCRRGSSVRRLLGYLFTEGLAGEHGLESEHRNARVLAGYEPAELLEPARDGQGRPQLTRLAALLDAPVEAGGVRPDAKPVYHWRSAPPLATGCSAMRSGRTSPASTCKPSV